jgi:hypothetical protein
MVSAITRSPSHEYSYAGATYPGVTGILKVIDKSDALMAWAARQTAEATVSLASPTDDGSWNVDGIAQLLRSVGPEGFTKAVTSRSAWKRDEAAQIGSTIHGIADKIAQGMDTGWVEPIVLERVEHYRQWWAASGWTLRLSEAKVVSPSIGYGGTFDLLAYDRDGKTVLADIKTGSGVYRETILQLAAYGMATFVQPADKPTVFPMVDPDRYAVLHVTAKGVKEIEVNVGQAERTAFLATVELAAWVKSVKGRL